MRITSVFLASCIAVLATILMISSVSVDASSNDDSTCYALAMSGGGDKAAYEAGVLKGLLANVPADEFAYNVVTGISAGSVVSVAMAVHPVGDEAGAVAMMLSIIDDLQQSSIFQEWPGGFIEGLMTKSSLFDSTPLRDLMTSVLSNKTLTDRFICNGVANLNSGLFVRLCDPASIADLTNHVLASSAIPGTFLDQTFGGETYVDGGTMVNVDVIGAVESCLALGYPLSSIVVDTIECSGPSSGLTPMPDASTATVIDVFIRAAMMRYSHAASDFDKATGDYPEVTFRYHIWPSQGISGSGIDFNQTQMQQMIVLGAADAVTAVANGVVRPGMKIQTTVLTL